MNEIKDIIFLTIVVVVVVVTYYCCCCFDCGCLYFAQ